MSTVNLDDLQHIPSDGIVRVQQSNNNTVIHQSPPNYTQINTHNLQNPHQHPTMLSYFNKNNEKMPMTVVHNPKNGPYSFSENINDIYHYTIWSIFNAIFCCTIVGVCALFMSCETKAKQRLRDFTGAQKASNIAAILNIVATLSGILIITLVTLRLTGHLTP
jgi:hypothetical protein